MKTPKKTPTKETIKTTKKETKHLLKMPAPKKKIKQSNVLLTKQGMTMIKKIQQKI